LKFTKEHIIESIRSGKDREVLSAMYKEIYPKIERYVTGNSGTKEDSKDVFQEAILVFYNNVINGNYDRINEITGFIITVSRNIWINKVRKIKKEVEGSVLENYVDHSPSPLISIIMEEKWTAYQELLDNIGSKCKELLNYSVYEKLSMKEIAVKMNFANENAAKTHNYRCKQKLMHLISSNQELTDLLKS
jgi:RNA polymerase sigma factor (sigma-70 family)